MVSLTQYHFEKGDFDSWSHTILILLQGYIFPWPLSWSFILFYIFSSISLNFSSRVLLGWLSSTWHPSIVGFPKLGCLENCWGVFCIRCWWVSWVVYIGPKVGFGIEAAGIRYSSVISSQRWWRSCDACFNFGCRFTVIDALSVCNKLSTFE